MKGFAVLFSVLFCLFAATVSMAGQQYHGTISSDLTLQRSYGHVDLKRALKVPARIHTEPGSAVYAGSFPLSYDDEAGTRVRVLLVVPPGGTPYIFVDKNRNGIINPDERVELALKTDTDDADDADDAEDSPPQDDAEDSPPQKVTAYTGQTSLPISIGIFKSYPIQITALLPDPSAAAGRGGRGKPSGSSSLELDFATEVSVNGTLNIDGKPVKVSYTLDVVRKKIDPRNGQLGMDCNMDGNIEHSYTSPEQASAHNSPVIFRVGTHYVTTTAVDVVEGTITAEERPAAEYRRIELIKGTQLPDFGFKDMEGKKHDLSELRGKYVVIDSWGTWCGSCREDIQQMKQKIYPQFHSRGLEILSLDIEHPGGPELPKRDALEQGRRHAVAYLRRHNIPWLQADEESIHDLVVNRLMVQRFPTGIVLNPEGKIIGIDWTPKEMERKFGELLPATGTRQF